MHSLVVVNRLIAVKKKGLLELTTAQVQIQTPRLQIGPGKLLTTYTKDFGVFGTDRQLHRRNIFQTIA